MRYAVVRNNRVKKVYVCDDKKKIPLDGGEVIHEIGARKINNNEVFDYALENYRGPNKNMQTNLFAQSSAVEAAIKYFTTR